MRLSSALGIIAIIGLSGTTGCAVVQRLAPPPPPEHYVCSDFDVDETDVIKRKAVALVDQFGAAGAEVRLIRYLCAPAFKFHDGRYVLPRDFYGPHLACYELRNLDPDGSLNQPVTLTNQFENRGLKGEVGARRLLCVPSAKHEIREGETPEYDHDRDVRRVEAKLDHFVCSDFLPDETDFDRDRMGGWMGDQFGPFEGPTRAPNYLCAPAEKIYAGKRKEPGNGLNGTHLACYVFAPKPAVGQPANVLVVNQLDRPPQRGVPVERHMFCVPTEKKRR